MQLPSNKQMDEDISAIGIQKPIIIGSRKTISIASMVILVTILLLGFSKFGSEIEWILFGAVPLLTFLLWHIRNIATNMPKIILHKNGITIPWLRVGMISVHDIVQITYSKNRNGTSMNLKIFEPQKYICKMSKISKINAHFCMALGLSPFSVNITNSSITQIQMQKIVSELYPQLN